MFRRFTILLTVIISLSLTTLAVRAACGPDLDEDGAVGVTDLLQLIGAWGPCESCDEDLDGDNSVTVNDLLALLAAWGPAVFEYPNYSDAEAEQIGLEMLGPDGPLSVPADTYDRINGDLDAIRAFEPALAGETHSPEWIATELIVQLDPEQSQQEYQCLNSFYQLLLEDPLFGDWYVLMFPGNLNAEALVGVYTAAPGVMFAEPNGLIGGQNFWIPTDMGDGNWQWNVDDGFTDCFDGCDCHRYYTFRTDSDNNVQLIDYQEVGPSYCEF